MGRKHHVELADGTPIFFAANGAFGVGGEEFFSSNGFVDAIGDFVGAEAGFTFFALHEWVSKGSGMTRSFPSLGVHQDGGVDAVNIVAIFNEKFPPFIHDFLFKGDAKGTVIPGAGKTAINVGAGENETTALT